MTEIAHLTRYERAVALLAEAKMVDEVMEVRDEAERLRLYARQAKNREAIADAMEIQIRAERRLGEMIIAAKAAGQISALRPGREGEPKCSDAERLPRVTLAEAGIDRKLSMKAQQLAAFDADRFASVLEGARSKIIATGAIVVNPLKDLTTADKQKRRDNREWFKAQQIIALPDQQFGIIYCDCEWKYLTRSAGGMDRSADNHYRTSSLAQLQARDVRAIAAPDCILFMWATVPMLLEAICVADAWGFALLTRDPETGFLQPDKSAARYVSGWVWLKEKMATGYWVRNEHELLLIFTKGNPVPPAMGTQSTSVVEGFDGIGGAFQERATQHSKKPDAFADEIARLWPHTPKLEMNARRPREGWTVWGDEAGGPVEAESTSAEPLKPFATTVQTDAIIREAYAADIVDFAGTIERLAREAGVEATNIHIRRRANRLGLGDRDRQREAVRKSNSARAGQ